MLGLPLKEPLREARAGSSPMPKEEGEGEEPAAAAASCCRDCSPATVAQLTARAAQEPLLEEMRSLTAGQPLLSSPSATLLSTSNCCCSPAPAAFSLREEEEEWGAAASASASLWASEPLLLACTVRR
jgi:hypothetical protein